MTVGALRAALLLTAALAVTGCSVVFHPADRIDVDGDGFFAVGSRDQLIGRSITELEDAGLDCDDNDSDVFPNAAELCDGKDNNCGAWSGVESPARFDEIVDALAAGGLEPSESSALAQELDLAPDEVDNDADGFSECGYRPGEGVTAQRDCNDEGLLGPFQAPDHTEVCGLPRSEFGRLDAIDDDCNGEVAQGEVDLDNDGYLACEAVVLDEPGEIVPADCLDSDATVNPNPLNDDSLPDYPQVSGGCLTDGSGNVREFTSECVPTTDVNTSELFVDWVPDRDLDGDGDENEAAWVDQRCVDDKPDDFVLDPATGAPNYLQLGGGLTPATTDCNDSNPALHRLDRDGDGFFACGTPIARADADFVAGGVTRRTDGNPAQLADSRADAYPGATESCDGVDNDLDGGIDENFDRDADGAFSAFATPTAGADACEIDNLNNPLGYLKIDCNDSDPQQNQTDADSDQFSTCDGDCNDGDSGLQPVDQDADGYFLCPTGGNPADCDDNDSNANWDEADGDGVTGCDGDCDDSNPLVGPNATALCDGILDTDCDGASDPLEVDDDTDGYIECSNAVAAILGFTGGNDCDDTNAAQSPEDSDGDGFSTCTSDCDDTDDDVFPGAPNLCDGIADNDCNSVPDANEADTDQDGNDLCGADGLPNTGDEDCDDLDPSVNSNDADGDGQTSCEGDCDDLSSAIQGGVDVDGDGWDEDCGPDGVVASGDEDCDDSDATLNLNDVDGDGNTTCGPDGIGGSADDDCDDFDANYYGVSQDSDSVSPCGADGLPETSDDDCNDSVGSVFPGASEVADGVDQDCDGVSDEGLLSAGDIVITEILVGADPATGDADGEYIEIRNKAGHTIDLRGWGVYLGTASGTPDFEFDSDSDPTTAMTIVNGGRAVLARSSFAFSSSVSVPTYTLAMPNLANTGDSITLSAPDAGSGFDDIDAVTWTGSGCVTNCGLTSLSPTYSGVSYWRPGFAMSLKPSVDSGAAPHTANNSMTNWCEERTSLGGNDDHGSPGLAPSSAFLGGQASCL